MSKENVEIVRSLAESFQSRDHERALYLYEPEIELDASRVTELMTDVAGVYRGHEGVRTFWHGGSRRGATFNLRFRTCGMPVTKSHC